MKNKAYTGEDARVICDALADLEQFDSTGSNRIFVPINLVPTCEEILLKYKESSENEES